MNEFLFYSIFRFSSSSLSESAVFFLAEYFGYFVSIAVFLWIVWKFRMFFIKKAVIAFSIPTFAWIFAHVLKDYFGIPRPFQILDDVTPLVFSTNAFQALPSGHATFFAALATSVYFLDKRVGVAIGVCAFVIGLARIMAGIHWPSDILAGWVLGVLIAMLLNEEWLYRLERRK
jgi:membrane-associated phospholipid phosphatase